MLYYCNVMVRWAWLDRGLTLTDSQVAIFYRCSIVTKSLSAAVSTKHIRGTTLTFQGHMTSSVTWPFDSQVAISYRHSIVIKSLSPAVSEIMDTKYIGVTSLTFEVTWPLDSGWVISYWWSFGPRSLSLTVSEIFCLKHLVLIDTMLNRHCACAISRDVYPLCKI